MKGKYAISILQKMPLDEALKALHSNYIQKYTNNTIETVFSDCRYIYSFVCCQSLLDELLTNRKCLLIIPESLSKVISFEPSIENVYIDLGH